ncbi:uncharacterized protein LOC121055540 [Oryza brachyantha]|uniref:Uncharacterized protein n=1 Tax=Oryza brachyantha TaxID=4533 RepID=J3N1D1_ORYBR|nr:uncharacterized protein LOC121055540 [Oryza brachyantha]
MTPLRRNQPRAAPARLASSCHKGWLSLRRRRCRSTTNRRMKKDRNGAMMMGLDDDVLSSVFTHISEAGEVVRCAATCRQWNRAIADSAVVIGRSLRLPVLPRLALGFFHQEATSKRKRSTEDQLCRFVPTAAGVRLLGPSFRPFEDGELLEMSRPVTSRNGRVVLELQREGHADALKLCVWNPMTGDVAMLPPLGGDDKPGAFACALLTADDLDPLRCPSATFFRVLIVYNQRAFTVLRSYSSDTGCWSTESRRSGPKMSSYTLQQLRQSVVHDGVAYWPMAHTALAVRIDTPEPKEVDMPPAIRNAPRHNHLLGVTADGNLSFIVTSLYHDGSAGVSSSDCLAVGSNGSLTNEPVDECTWRVRSQELRVHHVDSINLRWFCERSGMLFFTVSAKGSSTPGCYVLNIAAKELEKVADDVDCSSWRNFVGYEMDTASYLASLACH